ncbi:phage adaptor protein [Lysinibacillus fusiformis]|uniref:phage adaptor protein n=1 Tax=Lysinibacillus fusiformis TaxID=28031 RepID=UPI00263AA233|nr:hypothetical protein [Lysinibacillus fusiformis]MDC6267722.1 hypothetical protein [Lysinibacillus sphaericus]MDN4967788.1 hypothetical protein [Lysinibacillus fusiformis]MDN4967844.1 hypothetical protein [Lysinibacillus fusiformis]
MKLKDILLDVNLMIPNSISDEIKVRWLNETQRQLYRDFGFPDTSYAFAQQPNVDIYPLPDNCSRERIISVTVDDLEYDYVSMTEDVKGRCWTMIDDNIWFYPMPVKEKQVFIVYKPEPRDMRLDMQEEEPEFPKDFHEILTYGVAFRVARSLQLLDVSGQIQQQMYGLQEEAKKKLRPNNRKRVVQTRVWR